MSCISLWYKLSQNILQCIQIKCNQKNLRFQIRDLGKRNYFGQEGSSYDIAGNAANLMISNEKGTLCFLALKHLYFLIYTDEIVGSANLISCLSPYLYAWEPEFGPAKLTTDLGTSKPPWEQGDQQQSPNQYPCPSSHLWLKSMSTDFQQWS